jgi:hypothetical protein
MKTFDEGLEELQKLLGVSTQHWLLGAGASYDAKIPLMYPLTGRVRSMLAAPFSDIVSAIANELPDGFHIEHILSHIGDLIAITSRTKIASTRIGTRDVSLAELEQTHGHVISAIASTIRYGYRQALDSNPEEVGNLTTPIVEVEHHQNFVKQLFKARANIEGRSRISFLTTNYDTLLEDALALERRQSIDGFVGGSIGFWTGQGLDPTDSVPPRSHVILKLHGSVDWLRSENGTLLRARYGTKYLSDLSNTLIYPQATKYVETQKDPFAKIFDGFRKSLRKPEGHILVTLGYSYGDEHINQEIEHALAQRENKTNIIAFSKEISGTMTSLTQLPAVLERWRNNSLFGSRIYIASDKALYCGPQRFEPIPGASLNWWTFAGLTRFLETGSPA